MVKKIISVILAALMLCVVFASCTDKKTADVSSKITASEQSSSEEIETSSIAASSETKTSSVAESSKEEEEEEEPETSSKKGFNRGETNSETTSSGIKQYKRTDSVMMGAFCFNPYWCTAYGEDYDSRMAMFSDIVRAGYFNTYILGFDKYFIDCAKVIAETGGTIWIMDDKYNSAGGKTTAALEENITYYMNELEKRGIRDVVVGWAWDEPLLNKQTPEDFLTQCKMNYTKFGFRNFPVFATSEFTGKEENDIVVDPNAVMKITKETGVYITDLAYDAYGVDARTDAGKEYYLNYKNTLKERIGHEVNYWYYPCAHTRGVKGINNLTIADEGYCIGHLEFMAEDMLKEKYPGGIILYTFHTTDGLPGLVERLDLKDEHGAYKIYQQSEKWLKYSQLLRDMTAKFSATKTTPFTKVG